MTDAPSEISHTPLLVKDYFVFETTSAEWLWVLQNLIHSVADPDPHDVLLVPSKDGASEPTYMLRKETYSAEMIAKAIGTTPEKVIAAKIIKLKPFTTPEGLPAPTVNGYGTA